MLSFCLFLFIVLCFVSISMYLYIYLFPSFVSESGRDFLLPAFHFFLLPFSFLYFFFSFLFDVFGQEMEATPSPLLTPPLLVLLAPPRRRRRRRQRRIIHRMTTTSKKKKVKKKWSLLFDLIYSHFCRARGPHDTAPPLPLPRLEKLDSDFIKEKRIN